MNGVSYDVFGGRKTAFAGLSLAAVGSLASSFVSSLPMLYITRGMVAGFGAGLLFHLAIPVLDKVFSKYKSLVLMFCFGNSGLGVVLLAILGKQAVEYGGWRWYYRMLALVSVLSMAGVLFIPANTNSSSVESKVIGKEEDAGNCHSTVEKCGSPKPQSPVSCWSQFATVGREMKCSFLHGLSLYRSLDFTILVIAYATLSVVYFMPFVTAVREMRMHVHLFSLFDLIFCHLLHGVV